MPIPPSRLCLLLENRPFITSQRGPRHPQSPSDPLSPELLDLPLLWSQQMDQVPMATRSRFRTLGPSAPRLLISLQPPALARILQPRPTSRVRTDGVPAGQQEWLICPQ